jgi:magnesium transporter
MSGSQSHQLIDLDDHRQHIASSLRGGSRSRSRRGTAGSVTLPPAIDITAPDSMLNGTVARDFENAIVDDNASEISHSSAYLGERRDTFRRNRPGTASLRSRAESPSPPTSIHAFGNRRRRDRSNTANTLSLDARLPDGRNLIHEPSVDGLNRRRLTFSGENEDEDVESSSTNTSAENDVCYPQSEHPEDGPEIDFEELHEFVAETQVTAPSTPAFPPRETATAEKPLSLPPAALNPDDDAFDELEKTKLVDFDRRPNAGAQRPFYTFFTSESEDTIHATSLGGLLNEDETFRELFSAHTEDGCWWLDIVRPSEEEVTVLCKAFGVHPLTREDITTEESREKVELFRHYYFVSFRTFEKNPADEDYLEPISVYAVVFRTGLFTFSHKPTGHADSILKRIRRLRDYMAISTDWIAYAMIDDIVDGFQPVIREIDKEVDEIEDSVFTTRDTDARSVFTRIGECRRRAMALLRLLRGKSDVVKGFAKRCNEHYSIAPTGDVGMYLSDIQDHIVTMRDNLSHSEQLLGRVHANYLAQINLDGIEGGNRTNSMLGKVTLIATIVVPCNLLAGLFGMNVFVP